MSENEFYRKRLIKEFLDEVELKLPFWLKNESDELKGVLKELEEHIEDKTEALEATGKTKLESTQLAIADMGSPSSIAREYKRRGTPKLYISEELFPTYLNVLRIAGMIVGIVTAVLLSLSVLITTLLGGNGLEAFFSGLSSFIIWTIIIAAGITALFTWLSYEGYFPDDLRKLFKSKKDLVKESKPTSRSAPPKTTISPKGEQPKREYPKRLDKPSGLIAGGIVTWVFGLLAIWQPFTQITVLFDPGFLWILKGIGIFWIIIGTFELVHGIVVSWSYQANKALYPARAVISLSSISMVIWLLLNPEVFPIPVWTQETGFQILSIATEFYWLYYLVGGLIILAIVATAIYNIVKGAILEEDYFLDA